MTSGDVTTPGSAGAGPGGPDAAVEPGAQPDPATDAAHGPDDRRRGLGSSSCCLLILLGILGERLTTQTLVTSVLMAIIPLLIIVPTFLWLDRYEAEPVRYHRLRLPLGCARRRRRRLLPQHLRAQARSSRRGWTDPLETGAVYLRPITEETLKGLGILLIYLLVAREFDGIIDGIVYAGLIGAGFAFSENILYLGQAYNEYGGEGAHRRRSSCAASWAPFGHPLFTSLTGIGIGIAVTARRPVVRVLAILTGWVCAMLLHGALEPLGPRRHGRFLRGLRDLPGAALPRLHRLPPLAPSS